MVTSKRKVPLNEAIENAREAAMLTTIPGTQITPIVAADVQVDKTTGIVTVNVIEDFSNIKIKGLNYMNRPKLMLFLILVFTIAMVVNTSSATHERHGNYRSHRARS